MPRRSNQRTVLRMCILLAFLLPVGLAVAQEGKGREGASVEDTFKRLDANGDGKLTPNELRQEELFKRMDKNGDGQVTLDEARESAGTRRRQSQPASGQEPKSPEMRNHLDIQYAKAKGVDPNLLSLDIYAPKEATNCPVMVYVHGGGWARGDKKAVHYKAGFFVGEGYIFVSVNYRLVPKIKHPTNVQDVANALAWVHDNAKKYGGDPGGIFLMGHSAGAHLVALAGTDDRRLKEAGKDLLILKGVIPLDTNCYDLATFMKEVKTEVYLKAFGKDPKVWKDASPAAHVAKNKNIPPFLIFVASNPAKGQRSEDFAKVLRKAGVNARVVYAPEHNHGSLNQTLGEPGEKTTKEIREFLDSLRGKSVPANQPFSLQFTKEYLAGVRDRSGKWMGGTETMRLVSHENMLFAAVSYWTDQSGSDPCPGGQILVKRSQDAPWEVERDFPGVLRVSAMESLTFKTDYTGKALPKPVNLLVADAALLTARKEGPLRCFVRDNVNGEWKESSVTPNAPRAFIRAFGFHRDTKTGIDMIFVGTGAGEVYSGAYDSAAPGRIRWNPKPEFRNPDYSGGAYKRCQGFCVANGKAYAAAAPVLVERKDGAKPEWKTVYRWKPDFTRSGAGLRGITAVPSQKGEHEVILASREQEGRILRIDPRNEFKAELELESHEFLRKLWEARGGGRLVAYNRFVPGKHPATGKPIHWVSVLAVKPGDRNAAWLLIRNQDASYEAVRVYDPNLKDHPCLVSTRTVEYSPWNEGVIYTGGYDGAANNRKNHNTAWIYKGVIQAKSSGSSNDTLFNLAYTHNHGLAQATALLDMFGNGWLDLAIASKRNIHFVRNKGGSKYEHCATKHVDNANGWGLHDFDRDGRMDLFIAQQHKSISDCWLNKGDGSFDPKDLGNETKGNTRNVLFADFDGDGNTDSYHSVSAFGANHNGCELHPGKPDGTFGPDIVEEVLDPKVPDFWYATANHPVRGKEKWANKMFKGAIIRDFDGDGKPDIITGAYSDRGFQEDDYAFNWVNKQDRGLFILHNKSQPGKIRFAEVARTAIGKDAYGCTDKDWNVYSVIPIDYDRDGDFDLFAGAVVRGAGRGKKEDTVAVRFFENVSKPGTIKFQDKTEEAGLAYINKPEPAKRAERSFASGQAIDFDNDGFPDLVLVNRRDMDKTSFPYVHLFRNLRNGKFEEVPPEKHGLGSGSGGRDLCCGDLNGDGLVDVVVNDGTVGGYDGLNNSRIYENRIETDNNWAKVKVIANDKCTPAIGAKVWVFKAGTDKLLGFDEVRTDFCYRSKRAAVLHFGLGEAGKVDVKFQTSDGFARTCKDLEACRTYILKRAGDPQVERKPSVDDTREEAPAPKEEAPKPEERPEGRKTVREILQGLDLSSQQQKQAGQLLRKYRGDLRNPDFAEELQKILTPEQAKEFQEELKKSRGRR